MDRRYSKLLVLATVALLAEACSSSGTKTGTGGAGGGSSSTGGATGTGGAGTGGRAGASGSGGMTGTGGRPDGGMDMTTSMGGMTGVDASDAPKDMSVADTGNIVDTGADADPAANEKAMCLTPMFMANITTMPFTAAEFCRLYFSECNDLGGVTHFATQADCRTAYNGYNMTPDADMSPSGQQGCRSYHLCNAVRLNVNPHCAHATGLSAFDAGSGPPCP
jgi:hypothetical protein